MTQPQIRRIQWTKSSHERGVEDLYSTNARGHTDIHGHYLNFGLWENGNTDYLTAAENMVHHLATSLKLQPGSKLLDVACGMGAQDFYLHENFGPLQIDALDVTWPHIRTATLLAAERGIDQTVRFHHASATDLPFKSQRFTHALCIEGSVHFDTRMKFLHEAHRVLKPGGRIALADYVLKRKPKNRVEKMILDSTLAMWKIPVANAITAQTYVRVMKGAGFRNMRIESVGDSTFPGYYFEQRKLEFRLHKIRTQGFLTGGLGFVIDIAAYQAYRLGLIDYVLVSGVK